MPRRLLLAIFVAALAVRAVTVAMLDNAGYFDAFYYQRVAENLAAGRGLVEDFAWMYLDDTPVSASLPRPAHGYWMPLPTWLAYVGLSAFGGMLGSFHAAAAPFVILGALVPVAAAALAWTLWERRDHTLVAGILGIFATSYFARWVTPDTFAPCALAVTAALAAGWRASRPGSHVGVWALAGAAAALAHLTRADGPLVLLVVVGLALRSRRYRGAGLAVAAYALVMAPWFARSLSIWGTLLPTAGAKTMWLTGYDEIWSFGLALEPGRFWAQGAATIAGQKLRATGGNLFDALHLSQYILLPLAIVGGRAAWRGPSPRLIDGFAFYGALVLVVLSVVFTFPSRFGSFFRSSAGLIPIMAALVPAGTEAMAERYASWRGKDVAWTRRFMRRAVLGVACGMSLAFFAQELWPRPGWGAVEPWNRRLDHYAAIAAELEGEAPVMVVNSPGFRVATGRASIAIPSNGPAAIAAAADRYGARWLVVESNVPWLAAVWRDAAPLAGFRHVRSYVDGMGSPVRLLERVGP